MRSRNRLSVWPSCSFSSFSQCFCVAVVHSGVRRQTCFRRNYFSFFFLSFLFSRFWAFILIVSTIKAFVFKHLFDMAFSCVFRLFFFPKYININLMDFWTHLQTLDFPKIISTNASSGLVHSDRQHSVKLSDDELILYRRIRYEITHFSILKFSTVVYNVLCIIMIAAFIYVRSILEHCSKWIERRTARKRWTLVSISEYFYSL